MATKKPAAINIIWLMMILISIVVAAYTGKMQEVTQASFDSAKNAVNLAISLIGAMAFWLGIMKVAEAGGLLQIICRAIKPVMVRLFPDVPAEHPAMSAMILNIGSNMLGLGNAATPMGIKAMQELDKLNPEKGTATNAMCLFLAINTSSVTIIPLGAVTIRAAAGVANPADIFLPTLFATCISTIVAVFMSKLLQSQQPLPLLNTSSEAISAADTNLTKNDFISQPGIISISLVWISIAAFVLAIVFRLSRIDYQSINLIQLFLSASNWMVPALIGFFLIFGFLRGVSVYEALCDGAKEGFQVATRILPFLVAIFVAIGMFRASNALDLLAQGFGFFTNAIGVPIEAIIMGILRTLSGSGAFGYMSEIVNRDPNSFLSFLVSTIQGSTETTFYVLAVYFGSVSIRKTRHALVAALTADFAGLTAAIIICKMMWF
ncbi:MAG: spore maturation protein [Desulfobacterales bacterium]|nr:spore maturation protein [Desulfobacterales bacterium]